LKEEPIEAAIRGLKSELGLAVATNDLKHLFNIQCANPMPNGTTHKVVGHVFLIQRDVDHTTLNFDREKIAQFAWVPLSQLMSEVGGTDTRAKYFPRANNYYPQLFEALQAWM
ncbi:MAG: NUDIX domain-containing protein, partial [Patescibacteria group bacterium]